MLARNTEGFLKYLNVEIYQIREHLKCCVSELSLPTSHPLHSSQKAAGYTTQAVFVILGGMLFIYAYQQVHRITSQLKSGSDRERRGLGSIRSQRGIGDRLSNPSGSSSSWGRNAGIGGPKLG